MEKNQETGSVPLDINTLNNLTNNMKSIEKEIIDLFFMNTHECLKLMSKPVNDNIWLSALKEIDSLAKCIGAAQICRTCSIARTIYMESEENRMKVCSNLNSNLEILKVFVRNTRY
ncbi:MAG: hypothetical protein PQ612_04920 [Rickettsiales bacterium]|nr:hypothetical protein [Pseudomonadota bacterium]MDA0966362.1 hypothetical protein [Pseudomonadota bacterium]MDG4543995.1 hypothetical protein [Rickettsiales bacterium]MDG4545489.1 hypothetical protein [Rickettsiales bacterium]MDG4547938.1 hypothetical protein [Rickettsiales bacterium]